MSRGCRGSARGAEAYWRRAATTTPGRWLCTAALDFDVTSSEEGRLYALAQGGMGKSRGFCRAWGQVSQVRSEFFAINLFRTGVS